MNQAKQGTQKNQYKMKALIWIIRGMGKPARVRQLKELIQSTQADIAGLQETIKQDFTNSELEAIAPGGSFYWNWLAATGHSGGILLGVKNDLLEIENWEVDDFFVGVTVRHRKLNFRWDFVNVYGPANHDLSPDFNLYLEDVRKLSSLWCQGETSI